MDAEKDDKSKKKRVPVPARKTLIESPMQLLDINDLVRLTRLGETTIRQLIKKHEFPKPVSVLNDAQRPTPRWRKKDYEDWAKNLETMDDKIPA